MLRQRAVYGASFLGSLKEGKSFFLLKFSHINICLTTAENQIKKSSFPLYPSPSNLICIRTSPHTLHKSK